MKLFELELIAIPHLCLAPWQVWSSMVGRKNKNLDQEKSFNTKTHDISTLLHNPNSTSQWRTNQEDVEEHQGEETVEDVVDLEDVAVEIEEEEEDFLPEEVSSTTSISFWSSIDQLSTLYLESRT